MAMIKIQEVSRQNPNVLQPALAETMPAPIASDATPAPVKANDPASAFTAPAPPILELGQ